MHSCRRLILHKDEWNQLRNKANLPLEPQLDKEPRDYIKELSNLSKSWIKSWPDTNENKVKKSINHKENRRKHLQKEWREHELAWLQASRENSKIAVKNAKQRIFDTTCYGQQLISALRESKAIEERELQIQFKMKQKNIAKDLDNELNRKCNFLFGVRPDDYEEKRKLKNIEIAELNRCMHKATKEKERMEAQEQQLLEQEDARFQKGFLIDEARALKKCDLIFKNAVKISLELDKRFRDEKKKANEADDAITTIWKKHQELCRKKERETLNMIHKERYNMPILRRNYEETERALTEFEKKYDFITKAAQEFERTEIKNYQKDIEIEKQSRQKTIEIAQTNKRQGEIAKRMELPTKCICDRSSLFTKSCYKTPKNAEKDRTNHNNVLFYNPSNNIRNGMEKSKNEPTPWSGLRESHKYFAEQASEILKECRYKHMAQKVVDNYRQTNLLDAEKLPISNY